MRRAQASTRLTANRLRWTRDGHRGQLLGFFELDEAERQFLVDEITQSVCAAKIAGDRDCLDRVFMDVLNEWGVMCPHNKRDIEKEGRVIRCNVCGCIVVTPPGHQLGVGLPG